MGGMAGMKVRVLDGTKIFVILFFKVDFKELLLIPIPEKVAKLVSQVLTPVRKSPIFND